jgi:hypothetical protein
MMESSAHDSIEQYREAGGQSISRGARTVQEPIKVPGLEAVVNAALSLGSNGRGKDGVTGYMAAMASKRPKRFALLLERALQLKNSEWRGGEAVLSDEQAEARIEKAEARIRKMSVDEIVMGYVINFVVPPLDGPPSSATDILEAIIDAARRHGSNGHGKDGVEGYIEMLAQIECRAFDRWVIRAMGEQVKGNSPKSIDEAKARLRERGVDEKKVHDLASVMKYGSLPPEKEPSSLLKDLEDCARYIGQQWPSLRSASEPADMPSMTEKNTSGGISSKTSSAA